MMDGADLQIDGLVAAERPLDLGQLLVGADGAGRVERTGRATVDIPANPRQGFSYYSTSVSMISEPDIRLKRVYDSPAAADGPRILVERLWPRGLTRERARIDHWCKEIAPSPALRRWFGHDPARWPEFVQRYRAELEGNPAEVARLANLCAGRRVTFVFAARDKAMNSAIVLREYLGAH